jgi:hypothetical protein
MKFLLTRELGRLATWLRILGFDTAYFNQNNPSSLIIQALREDRIILTRNQRLPKAGGIRIVLLKAQKVQAQLKEALDVLRLKPDKNLMFSRCIICNEELAGIDKEKVKDKVPEYVFKTQEDFVTCPKCKRIYWRGTHWGNVEQALKEVI